MFIGEGTHVLWIVNSQLRTPYPDLSPSPKGSPHSEDSPYPGLSPYSEDSPSPDRSPYSEDSPFPSGSLRLDSSARCSSTPFSGVRRLVESISTLQTERSKLASEVEATKVDMEHGETEKKQLSANFQIQIQKLKERIKEREEELNQLRMETGVTDSEKRIQHLSLENESLKQNLSVTQGLLQQLSSLPLQPSPQLLK
ncbi:hypothetical protein scyTo_0022916, partial [Scyliorhinus torazame]|nr:hypothetical protein [Scyliorhinus torazame]